MKTLIKRKCKGDRKILRGGGFCEGFIYLNVSFRSYNVTYDIYRVNGFRIVMKIKNGI